MASHTLIERFMEPTWGHLGPTGPRWAWCWPHDPCYLGTLFYIFLNRIKTTVYCDRQTCYYLTNYFTNSKADVFFAGLNVRNKANLRDLIAATGLVILLKLDSNRWFFNLCDLEIWWMTLKNYRAPLLLGYIKLCASFQSHRWIQTGVTVRKRSIRVKIGDFLSRVTLKFDAWPWQTTGQLFCNKSIHQAYPGSLAYRVRSLTHYRSCCVAGCDQHPNT